MLRTFSKVFKCFSDVFVSVSDICFRCFICLQMYVSSVAFGYFKSRSECFTWNVRGKRERTRAVLARARDVGDVWVVHAPCGRAKRRCRRGRAGTSAECRRGETNQHGPRTIRRMDIRSNIRTLTVPFNKSTTGCIYIYNQSLSSPIYSLFV